MNGRSIASTSLLAVAAWTLTACAERVWMLVPAKMDLSGYTRIGLAELRGSEVELRRRATTELAQGLFQARPGILVVELGALSDDSPRALQEVARANDVDAVFLGTLQFSKPTPSVGVTSSLIDIQARADVNATLGLRLIEPQSGATVWVGSANDCRTVASAGVSSTGGGFGVSDLDATKADMLGGLIETVTWDFRDQYFRKKREEIPPHYRVTYPDGVEVYAPPEADVSGTR